MKKEKQRKSEVLRIGPMTGPYISESNNTATELISSQLLISFIKSNLHLDLFLGTESVLPLPVLLLG